ncbi:hypothetical protein BDA99DRAFT_523940 [Phascolomyces articulosus]|uniref:Transcription initiation factor IIF subunit alpha n=1 Tax=Phascolomyces articulosus TaxID=60185 RepID=A0AAD5JR11_9FUNG|nr:hypothetical protein BDA99DRAFT_523940 [Phascolomyces articulosus]
MSSSIYNTSHSPVKGRGRGISPQRHSPMGMNGQRPMRPGMRRPNQQQQQQQATNIPYNDFQLMSSKHRGKNHVMDFKTAKKVDFNNFARPVKLQRKDGNPHYNRFANRGSPHSNAATPAQGGTASPNNNINNSTTGTPNNNNTNGANNSNNNNNSETGSSSQQQPQHQHGPKTGADTSLIAPLGGATRNKQMLFKKRTKQIYLAKEDTRQLKEEEHKPWILEDYDSQNSFTGTYEGGQRSDYVFFVVSGNDFKVVPVDRWYKFQAKRNFRTFTLEEAEEQLKSQQKRDQSRWMMLKRNKQMADEEEAKEVAKTSRKPASDDEDDSGRRKSRNDSDIDDLDFDDVFQDDEEGGAEHELEDEDMKDSKERLKREAKGYTLGGEVDDEDDQVDDEELNKLTSEGKQMKKLVRTLEKNRAYESDEEGDPYASSEDEVDSDAERDESKSEAENSQQEQEKQKEKKPTTPAKKKGPVPGSGKAGLQKKGLAAKVKKEGLSRPIGRPGSPSLQVKKEYHGKSPSPPPPRQTSPKASVHSREASPVAPTTHTKKRKAEESVAGPDAKHRHRPTAASPSAGGSSSDDLITEEEVIATLRGKRMTTKEFLMHFRKRIKKNDRNRDIITSLLKKVARHNTTDDPNTRVLELRPELH